MRKRRPNVLDQRDDRLLPNDLQAKLNLPRWGCRGINFPRSVDRRSVLIEKRAVVKGGLEVCMVHNVKELGPELNIETSRACFDVVVLKYREIDVDQAWPDHGVPAVIAK